MNKGSEILIKLKQFQPVNETHKQILKNIKKNFKNALTIQIGYIEYESTNGEEILKLTTEIKNYLQDLKSLDNIKNILRILKQYEKINVTIFKYHFKYMINISTYFYDVNKNQLIVDIYNNYKTIFYKILIFLQNFNKIKIDDDSDGDVITMEVLDNLEKILNNAKYLWLFLDKGIESQIDSMEEINEKLNFINWLYIFIENDDFYNNSYFEKVTKINTEYKNNVVSIIDKIIVSIDKIFSNMAQSFKKLSNMEINIGNFPNDYFNDSNLGKIFYLLSKYISNGYDVGNIEIHDAYISILELKLFVENNRPIFMLNNYMDKIIKLKETCEHILTNFEIKMVEGNKDVYKKSEEKVNEGTKDGVSMFKNIINNGKVDLTYKNHRYNFMDVENIPFYNKFM